jgi:hypothetical protein
LSLFAFVKTWLKTFKQNHTYIHIYIYICVCVCVYFKTKAVKVRRDSFEVKSVNLTSFFEGILSYYFFIKIINYRRNQLLKLKTVASPSLSIQSSPQTSRACRTFHSPTLPPSLFYLYIIASLFQRERGYTCCVVRHTWIW